jgi:hypothetical protein
MLYVISMIDISFVNYRAFSDEHRQGVTDLLKQQSNRRILRDMNRTPLAELSARVLRMQRDGLLPVRPSVEQRISWAYGQTAIENPSVTPEIARAAVEGKLSQTK